MRSDRVLAKKQQTIRPFDAIKYGICANCPAGCGVKAFMNGTAPVDFFHFMLLIGKYVAEPPCVLPAPQFRPILSAGWRGGRSRTVRAHPRHTTIGSYITRREGLWVRRRCGCGRTGWPVRHRGRICPRRRRRRCPPWPAPCYRESRRHRPGSRSDRPCAQR